MHKNALNSAILINTKVFRLFYVVLYACLAILFFKIQNSRIVLEFRAFSIIINFLFCFIIICYSLEFCFDRLRFAIEGFSILECLTMKTKDWDWCYQEDLVDDISHSNEKLKFYEQLLPKSIKLLNLQKCFDKLRWFQMIFLSFFPFCCHTEYILILGIKKQHCKDNRPINFNRILSTTFPAFWK